MLVNVAKEIAREHLSLRRLDKALGCLTPALTSQRTHGTNGGIRPVVRVSTRVRGARILQGRHMGYMRQLRPRQKAQVRKIREAKGVRAAIERAKVLVYRGL